MNSVLCSLFVSVLLADAPQTKQTPAPAQVQAPADPELHQVEQNIIKLTNEQRARFGLRPLRLDGGLLKSARRHTGWMARSGRMQHTSAPVAENIAMGQNNSTQALNSWMNSSGHRANILSAGYTRIGVAAYRSPNGAIYWCQQFK